MEKKNTRELWDEMVERSGGYPTSIEPWGPFIVLETAGLDVQDTDDLYAAAIAVVGERMLRIGLLRSIMMDKVMADESDDPLKHLYCPFATPADPDDPFTIPDDPEPPFTDPNNN